MDPCWLLATLALTETYSEQWSGGVVRVSESMQCRSVLVRKSFSSGPRSHRPLNPKQEVRNSNPQPKPAKTQVLTLLSVGQ